MTLKAAVIGAGSMGNNHVRQLASIEEVQVVSVVDTDDGAARRVAEEHGVPAWHTDHGQMLAETSPDYVVVSSPARYHAEQAIAAFAAGAHVLVEKPLCMTVAEAESIEAEAKKHGRRFTMGFQERQKTSLRALREYIAAGGLGLIYHSRVWGGHIMGYPHGAYHHRQDMSLGGVAAATVVHALDACMWAIGFPEPATVSASTFRRLDKMKEPHVGFQGRPEDATVEDYAHAHVRFADGSSMSIEGNWLMHPSDRANGFEVFGVNGVARDTEPYVELEEGREVVCLPPDYEPDPGNAYRREHVEFVEAIRGRGEPIVTFREAVAVQRILNGLYESAEIGSEVGL